MHKLIDRGLRTLVLLVKKACRKIRSWLTKVKARVKIVLSRYFKPELYKNNPGLFLADMIPLLIKLFVRRGKMWVIGALALLGLAKAKLDSAVIPLLILTCNLALFATWPEAMIWLLFDIVVAGVVLGPCGDIKNEGGGNPA